jgi:hypothetical protein
MHENLTRPHYSLTDKLVCPLKMGRYIGCVFVPELDLAILEVVLEEWGHTRTRDYYVCDSDIL